MNIADQNSGTEPVIDSNLVIVGVVRSSIKDRATAPKIEHEGGVEARIEFKPPYADALKTLEPGKEVWLFTWLHLANRSYLEVHPRGDHNRPKRGVFNTRSPDRPNPIGLHKVRILEVGPGAQLKVAPLEVLDGTPVIDIKPVI